MKSLGVLGIAFAIALFGCSSSNGDGSVTATQTSCNAYCEALIPVSVVGGAPNPACKAQYMSVDDCERQECAPLVGASSSCQSAFTAYYNCEKSQADICADTECQSQFAAVGGC